MGDGKGAGEEHKVRFELADEGQLEYVGGLVAKLLGRDPKPLGRDGTFYTVDYDSVALSTFLDQDFRTLVEYLRDFKGFLQGFFDAEGHAICSVDMARRRVRNLTVGAANTNLDYLNHIGYLLARLGIDFRLYRTNKAGQKMVIRGQVWTRKHDVYHILVRGDARAEMSYRRVGFRNAQKAEKLSSLVEMIPTEPSQRFAWFTARYARKDRKWLRMKKGVQFKVPQVGTSDAFRRF